MYFFKLLVILFLFYTIFLPVIEQVLKYFLL